MKRQPLKRKAGSLKWKPLTRNFSSLPKKKLPDPDKIIEQIAEDTKMRAFFYQCWERQEREHGVVRCYETGVRIPPSLKYNTTIYHHILAKKPYPEYKFMEWNIVIIMPDVHEQVHTNMEKTPKVQALTQRIKKEYGGLTNDRDYQEELLE